MRGAADYNLAVSQSFEIGPVQVGAGRLFLIAGPCVIESETHARTMAEAIQRITSDVGIPYIFKASYDKANRTSVKSFRGPGLEEGVRILGRVAQDTGLPVLTDVHEPAHCEFVAQAVDVLQIPAFLCRQTDLLVAAGKTGRAINIKKGQFVAPWDMSHPVEKVRSTGNERVFLTERGATFGYNTLVVDYRSLPVMRRLAPVVFDGTHSVQQPSAANGVSGGQPEFIPHAPRWQRAWMVSFSRCTTTRRMPSRMGPMRCGSICSSRCWKRCWRSKGRPLDPDPGRRRT